MIPNMSVVIKSPDAYTTFVTNVSSEALTKIILSDDLAVTERSIWDLVLDWACHQTNISKSAIEARLASLEKDDGSDNEELDTHLSQVKETLTPILPAIRFSLLDPDDYVHMANTLNYFLPRHRFFKINRYFLNINLSGQLDLARAERPRKKQNPPSNIVTKSLMWEFLRKNIFETGCISGCSSSKDLKFDLLFRASEHNFRASTFHQLCDNKGPTLTLVKSVDGHLFGGVNFVHWKSDDCHSFSPSNFLFALTDGNHRKNTLIFKNNNTRYSTYNGANEGPWFMGDLAIKDFANSNTSISKIPHCYNGSEASRTALAGAEKFIVSEYEVFAISKT